MLVPSTVPGGGWRPCALSDVGTRLIVFNCGYCKNVCMDRQRFAYGSGGRDPANNLHPTGLKLDVSGRQRDTESHVNESW